MRKTYCPLCSELVSHLSPEPKPDPELIQYFRNINEWDILKKLLQGLLKWIR